MAHVDMKVVLLGKEYCGKTSVVERFVNERFSGENRYQNTIGAAYGARKMEGTSMRHNQKPREIMMGVWDTAGSERYEAMSRIYYRGARAAVVCYDVTDADSWKRLRFWIDELRKFEESCKIYICATKVDLVAGAANKKRRKVDYHNTTDFADEIGAVVFETSSKSGDGVDEMFQRITDDYLDDPMNSYTEFERSGKRKLGDSNAIDANGGKSACC
jgi:Ras-related protein Rab-24